eukprot:jgi/Undpi1/5436/HiC_scaffold_2.g00715.m1
MTGDPTLATFLRAKVAFVNGGYSGVLETSCGSSAIAVGDTLYELSGVEFTERDRTVIDMSSADCEEVTIAEPADCYSGDTSSSLDGGIELTVTICYCKHVDGSTTAYRSNVGANVQGANVISVPKDEVHICFDFDYVSQMTAFVVEGETYYYDFELEIPGDDTSSDLSIADAPSSSADAFLWNTSRPAAAVVTLAPMVLPTPTPVSVPPTGAPVGAARPTLEPTAAATNDTIQAPNTVAPSPADEESVGCDLPQDVSCTQNTWVGNLNQGIGTFYDPVCNTTATGGEKEPGCQGNSEVCRLCLFNATRFTDSNPGEELPNYTICPCCVLDTYGLATAADAESLLCGITSPAPSIMTTSPTPVVLGFADRQSRTQNFQDTSLRVGGGNGVAVAALGLLGVLTFLPICSK